jgi:hypothetical protein
MAACHLVLAVFAAISLVSCSDLVKVMEANLEPAEGAVLFIFSESRSDSATKL